MEKVQEFRGVDNLVYAKVTDDTLEAYTTSDVKMLAPVAEISKTTETSSNSKYYDNKAMLTINAEGADTVNVTVPALDLMTLADLVGKPIDTETGAFIDGETEPTYIALGYRLKKTDGTYRYVWRYKCSCTIPDETSATENAGTDTNNQQLTVTGVHTIHKFTKTGKSQKALVVDESDNKADLTDFFDKVTTIDTLKPLTPPSGL